MWTSKLQQMFQSAKIRKLTTFYSDPVIFSFFFFYFIFSGEVRVENIRCFRHSETSVVKLLQHSIDMALSHSSVEETG